MVSRCCRSSLLVLATLFGLTTGAAALPPEAQAGDPQEIPCALPTGAEVTLDGTGSSDPDGDTLSYSWTGPSLPVPSTEAKPTLTLPVGENVITLTVTDPGGATGTDAVMITVIADTTAPELVLADESDELWPPNHKLHGYEVADLVDSVSDDCSELTPDDVVFGHASSDERDDGRGDGNTRDDVQFSDACHTADVRAERSGPGDGRVYELVLEVTDEAGNRSEQVFTVEVPHDRAHDADDSGDVAEYDCKHCARRPTFSCTEAPAGEIKLRATSKGPSLRWCSSGFPAGSVSAEGNTVCAYMDDAAAGGSLDPDKVKVRNKNGAGSLYVKTRGDDLELPSLPLEPGALLRLELHDGAGDCVSYEEVAE